jgi:Mg2+/Co2+ transporter CorB
MAETTDATLLRTRYGTAIGTCVRSGLLALSGLCFAETPAKTIESAFKDFTNRDDIAIVLISQNVASMIRAAISQHTKVMLLFGSSLRAVAQY